MIPLAVSITGMITLPIIGSLTPCSIDQNYMESQIDVGLLTSSLFPELQKDYIPLLNQFESMNLNAIPIVWNDTNFDWSKVRNLIFAQPGTITKTIQNSIIG